MKPKLLLYIDSLVTKNHSRKILHGLKDHMRLGEIAVTDKISHSHLAIYNQCEEIHFPGEAVQISIHYPKTPERDVEQYTTEQIVQLIHIAYLSVCRQNALHKASCIE